MCGTEMPGVSSRYIRGWSLTWVQVEERQLLQETTSYPYSLWCRLCPPRLSPNWGRSSSHLVQDGRGGQRWNSTLRWSDLNLLIRLLLPTLGMPITSRVLSGRSARCHLDLNQNVGFNAEIKPSVRDLSSAPTSLDTVGMMAAVSGQ